jgi:hypothetical protein
MAQGTAVDQECRPGIDNSNAVASGSLVVMFQSPTRNRLISAQNVRFYCS